MCRSSEQSGETKLFHLLLLLWVDRYKENVLSGRCFSNAAYYLLWSVQIIEAFVVVPLHLACKAILPISISVPRQSKT